MKKSSLFIFVTIAHFGFGFPHLRAAETPSKYTEAYPEAASKKGLQVEIVDDALELGVRHAALNLDLCRVIAPDRPHSKDSWQSGDRRFTFNSSYVERLDRSIKPLSDAGVLVNLILLAYQSGSPAINKILLHPKYDSKAPNRLGAFNTATPEGRAWLDATLSFLAERWSRPAQDKGRVVGYIVGNEVNSHWWWSNMGRVSLETFVEEYHQTVRLFHRSIRSQSSWARVYLSLEHHWSIAYPPADEGQAFPGRPFLDHFNELAKKNGDFDWHLAYHPYPESLFDPKFWEDTTALPEITTPRITFKNLPVLSQYLDQKHLKFNGKRRRVILSEQGFHTPDSPDGELIQAAAYCYAYKIVEQDKGIDAFILHRHVDHPHEGGLHLGLRDYFEDRPERPKKKIYDCFKFADTPRWKQTFEFALPIVGLEAWPNSSAY